MLYFTLFAQKPSDSSVDEFAVHQIWYWASAAGHNHRLRLRSVLWFRFCAWGGGGVQICHFLLIKPVAGLHYRAACDNNANVISGTLVY